MVPKGRRHAPSDVQILSQALLGTIPVAAGCFSIGSNSEISMACIPAARGPSTSADSVSPTNRISISIVLLISVGTSTTHETARPFLLTTQAFFAGPTRTNYSRLIPGSISPQPEKRSLSSARKSLVSRSAG